MIKRFVMSVMLMSLCLFAAPISAVAYDAFSGVDCSGAQANSAVCTDKTTKDPISDADGKGLISNITDIIAIVAGAFAIVMIIVSGYRFITSGGDSAKITDARKTLTAALIGVAVIILARTIIAFTIGQLE